MDDPNVTAPSAPEPAGTSSPAPITREALMTTLSAMLERSQFASRAGLTFQDPTTGAFKRDLQTQLGYAPKIATAQYRARYERGGIAERIVEAAPRGTWVGGIDVQETDDPDVVTEFETELEDLFEAHGMWSRLLRVDILAGIGRYGILILGAEGEMSEALEKINGPEGLLYVTPLAEDRALVGDYVKDPLDPRYGKPLYYQCTLSEDGTQKRVHYTRVVHVAEGSLESDVIGRPRLRAVWNYLDDLDKVVGGGAEAAWKRMDPGMQLDIDPEIMLDQKEETALSDMIDEYVHGLRRVVQTRGAKMQILSAGVSPFGANSDSLLDLIAGTTGIPKRILIGSERGELASTQDRSNWSDRITERRMEFAEPLCRELIDRLINLGALPEPMTKDEQRAEAARIKAEEEAAKAAALAAEEQRKADAIAKMAPAMIAQQQMGNPGVPGVPGSQPGAVPAMPVVMPGAPGSALAPRAAAVDATAPKPSKVDVGATVPAPTPSAGKPQGDGAPKDDAAKAAGKPQDAADGDEPKTEKGRWAYTIVWPEVAEMDESARAQVAGAIAAANGAQMQAEGTLLLSSDEIRDRIYGLKPLPPKEEDVPPPEPGAEGELPPGADGAPPPGADGEPPADGEPLPPPPPPGTPGSAKPTVPPPAGGGKATAPGGPPRAASSTSRSLAARSIETVTAGQRARIMQLFLAIWIAAASYVDAAAVEAALNAGDQERAEQIVSDALDRATQERAPAIEAALHSAWKAGGRATASAAAKRGTWVAIAPRRSLALKPPQLVNRGGFKFDFDAFDPRGAEWAATGSSFLITNVSKTTKATMRQFISDGMAKQYSKRDIARKLARSGIIGLRPDQRDLLNEFEATGATASAVESMERKLLNERALLIARTETNRSAHEGQLGAWRQAQESGALPGKQMRAWIATLDDRVRDSHRQMHLTVAPLDEPFEELDEDGEPTGDYIEPGELPNCRCTQALVVSDFVAPDDLISFADIQAIIDDEQAAVDEAQVA